MKSRMRAWSSFAQGFHKTVADGLFALYPVGKAIRIVYEHDGAFGPIRPIPAEQLILVFHDGAVLQLPLREVHFRKLPGADILGINFI